MTAPAVAGSRRTGARFAAVGIVNTAIDFGLYLLLQAGGAPVLLANTLSTGAGLAFSYFANRRFTFGVRGRHEPLRLVLFVLVTGAGLWLLQPLVIVGVGRVLPAVWPALLAAAVAKAAAIGVGMVWNFSWYRSVVFRTGGDAPVAG